MGIWNSWKHENQRGLDHRRAPFQQVLIDILGDNINPEYSDCVYYAGDV